jgi:tetratricopeptide (TPR) repeat protein
MATDRLAANLSDAMLNQSDPEIVKHGAPAYLLLIDSLIAEDPENPKLLLSGAKLYGAYGGGLISDTERQRGLMEKAMDYASRGLCKTRAEICAARSLPFGQFTDSLQQTGPQDLAGLYVYGTSWAGWVRANRDDWNAVAELAKAEAVLLRVIELNPAYEKGRAQLYLGVIRSLAPPALGGKPEIGRKHFEQAIAISEGQDLIAKVEFARHYARLVFDQELHDRLLHEVVEADPNAPGLTLSNVLAQQQARALLDDEYF